MPWAAAGAVGAALISSDASRSASNKAADAAKASKFTPYNTYTGYGNTTFDQNNHSVHTSLDPTYQGFKDQYTNQAGMLGNQLQNFSQGDVSQNMYSKLQQLQAYQNQQNQNQMYNDLTAKGMLGSTGGGQQMKGYYDSLNQASLQNALAGMQYGQQYQQNLMNMYNQNVQGATQMDALPMQSATLGLQAGGLNTQANQFGAQLQYGAALNQSDANTALAGGMLKNFGSFKPSSPSQPSSPNSAFTPNFNSQPIDYSQGFGSPGQNNDWASTTGSTGDNSWMGIGNTANNNWMSYGQ